MKSVPPCLGAVEELVASHKVVLQEQQSNAQNLEKREKELQQEVQYLMRFSFY